MRVGLVGAGAIARKHVEALTTRDGVEVASVCDHDAGRARDVAEPVDAAAYTEWQRMLASEQLDALFVCTPPAAHAAPTIASLERGLPVYLEKPLARSLHDGDAILEAWRTSGTVCAVGYQWRSLDLLAEVRRQLAGAAPGMLVSRSIAATEAGRGDLQHAAEGPAGSWFVDPAQSGGILFELGSHDIDLQVAIAGPASSVQAFAAHGLLALSGIPPRGLDDAVTAIIRFQTGAIGAVHVAWTDVDRPPVHELDVVAANAVMHLALDPAFHLTGRAQDRDVDETAQAEPRESSISRFLDAVSTGNQGDVACSPDDALTTLAIALACERAVATGQRVDLQPANGV
jgi:predicted dehydrogenase